MNDLMQEALFVGMDVHNSSTGKVTSTTTGDWVNMENFQKVTFVFTTGKVTVGGKIGIRQGTNKSGGTATTITNSTPAGIEVWVGGKDYTAAAGTYTAASTTSSGAYMNVANSDDSKTMYATFDATNLSTAKPYVAAYFLSAAWSAVITGTYVLWNPRYQQGAMPDPTL